jgi:hypothetical protein
LRTTLPIITGRALFEGALGDFGTKIADFAVYLGELGEVGHNPVVPISW